MQKQQRMIKNIISEAAKTDVVMPWARGANRRAWIARRSVAAVPLKVVHN